ncbi:hypothetical protein PILCRDRAFT_7051 [Piloderma croceum F 1598]|uniref:Uncharacterized protein n=1 Tax=Piloderma croceum (strain F 1598) TaxID=765440 RepID=A0A0C3BBI6_PILCF|nr:hypothetical protein PILCRDRAFT_7051 [Piloderma croceum F 1598]
MAYEEGFGDILMGDRASERHETFMGAQDLSASISRSDLLVFEARLLQQMREFMTIGTSPHGPFNGCRSPADLHILRSEESAPDLHLSPSPPDQLSEPETPTTRTIRRPKYGPPRIPTANSLDDVLRYWEDGAPEKGLVVPLANWCINFKPHEYRK